MADDDDSEQPGIFGIDAAAVAAASVAAATALISNYLAGMTIGVREALAIAQANGVIDVPVRSDALASLSYNPVDGVLRITFRDGAVYDYPDTSMSDFLGLLNASSKGSHYNRYFRGKASTQFAGSKKQRIKLGRG